MYIRTYMLPYVYGPYIFFRPCVCAENRGKNIKKIYIYIFALALGTWRGSSSCCCWMLCTEIVPATFDPLETRSNPRSCFVWQVGFLLLLSLVVMLLSFSNHSLLFFSTNWLFYWITQAAGGSPRLFPQEPSSSSGLRDYIGLNRRGVSPSPATITSRAFKDIASACLLASLWNFLLSFSSLCVWLK